MHAWQIALVVPVVVFVVVPAIADAGTWILRHVFAGRRGAVVVASGAAAGAILALWQYPALAAQLSSKAAYESYWHARRGDEPLALCGVSRRQLGSYEGASPPSFDDARTALEWLVEADRRGRRFLLANGERFAALNQLFRERTPPPHANLPVIDGRSSAIILVASALAPGEVSANPLDAFMLAARPSPQHPVRADMSGEVEILGYDVVDAASKRVDTVAAGQTYRVRTYYEVEKRPTVAWQAFVHIDGHGRRHNADHALLGGKYGSMSWIAGDLLVDEYELALPPNFTPGAYRLYFGFFQGDRRLKVTSGPSDGQDRIDGGDIRVN
jgi:hypothetical protein